MKLIESCFFDFQCSDFSTLFRSLIIPAAIHSMGKFTLAIFVHGH